VTSTVGQVAQAEWAWVRDWSAALVRFMLNDTAHGEANAEQIADWLEDWGAMARDAIDALEPVLTAVDVAYTDTRERINQDHAGLLQECGLKPSEVAV
jgi:hypothetical protein